MVGSGKQLPFKVHIFSSASIDLPSREICSIIPVFLLSFFTYLSKWLHFLDLSKLIASSS